MIASIDAVDLMDFSDITVSDDVADGLIATDVNSRDCADTNVLDYVVDGLMVLMCQLLLHNLCYGNDVMVLETMYVRERGVLSFECVVS